MGALWPQPPVLAAKRDDPRLRRLARGNGQPVGLQAGAHDYPIAVDPRPVDEFDPGVAAILAHARDRDTRPDLSAGGGLAAAQDRGEDWLTVEAVLEPEHDGGWRVNQDRPITEVISSENLGRLGALMAVDGDGVLRGVVTVEQVRRALQAAFGSSFTQRA